jgi:hypothetical protein
MASLLKQSHVVIYSITEDPKGALDTLKALESNENEEENDITSKKYIAVSSVLTWSRNPVYANETKGHKEDDYKQRKPTRKYGEIKTVETQILSANRDELQTCIVAAGLVYGGAQTNFQYLFRYV